MPRKQIKLSVRPELYQALAKRARLEKLPLSTFIRSVAENYIDEGGDRSVNDVQSGKASQSINSAQTVSSASPSSSVSSKGSAIVANSEDELIFLSDLLAQQSKSAKSEQIESDDEVDSGLDDEDDFIYEYEEGDGCDCDGDCDCDEGIGCGEICKCSTGSHHHPDAIAHCHKCEGHSRSAQLPVPPATIPGLPQGVNITINIPR
jgi:hypothetical protein